MRFSGATAVDTVRQAAATTANAMHVRVRTKRGVQGVCLRMRQPEDEPQEPGGGDEAGGLLRAFSPWFVLFPDATPGSKPPSGDGEEDYHPRPPEAFLDGASPYIASPQGWVSGAYVLATIGLLGSLANLWLRLVIGDGVAELDLQLVLLSAGFLLVLALLLIAQAPIGISRLRRQVGSTRPTDRLAVRRAHFDPPLDWLWARRAWKEYQRSVVASGKFPRRIYGRVVPVGEERYLQYWQFYVFNDWHNKHEADWEVVVVRVGRLGEGWAPVGAAYSSHFGGHWRPPGEIQWRVGTHPLVYVAQGSHAQYFESREGGYTATLTRSFGSLRIQVGRSDWVDVLAEDPDPEASPLEYDLAILPEFDPKKPFPAELLADWWWLGYRGLWGGGGAIPGPIDQGAKWQDPAGWIPEAVERDSPGWERLRPKAPS